MSFDAGSLATIIVAIIAAVGGYAGTRATAKSSREAAEPANWQSLTAEMKAYYKERFDEQDARITALEDELGIHRDYIAYIAAMPEFTDPPFPSFHKWRTSH